MPSVLQNVLQIDLEMFADAMAMKLNSCPNRGNIH